MLLGASVVCACVCVCACIQVIEYMLQCNEAGDEGVAMEVCVISTCNQARMHSNMH